MSVQKLAVQKLAVNATRQINAVVVSSGLMQRTVKARVGDQKWDGHIRKHFNRTTHVLVHDPRSSLRTGDVISISPGWRYSKHVHHVVNSIIAPFGEPLDERPPIPSLEERVHERGEKRMAKEVRRRERRREEGARMRGVVVEKGKGGSEIEGGKTSARTEKKESRENVIPDDEQGQEEVDRDPAVTVL